MKYSWTKLEKKVRDLVKKVSDAYGGDDPEWLRGYTDDLIEAGDLDGVLLACEGLLEASRGPVLILTKYDFPRMEKERWQDGIKPTEMDSRHCMAAKIWPQSTKV